MTGKVVVQLPIHQQLVCSECGAPGEGSCRCGAAYVPAGQRAADAVAKSPEKSDRAIAKEIGIDEHTVRVSRITGSAGNPAVVEAQGLRGPDGVIRRLGRDGKWRRLPQTGKGGKARKLPRKAKKPAISMQDEVNQMIGLVLEGCGRLETFLGERTAELEQEDNNPNVVMSAKDAIIHALYDCADRMSKLAQKVDGR